MNEMHLSFLSVSENEGFARTAVASFVAYLNPTMEEISDIRTSVSEAVTNAIIHGYGNEKTGIVYIDCKVEDMTVEIRVRDEGSGMEDIALAMQPFYTSMPNLERSGMGFAVMEAFMDSVSVESALNKGTIVLLKKKIVSENQENSFDCEYEG